MSADIREFFAVVGDELKEYYLREAAYKPELTGVRPYAEAILALLVAAEAAGYEDTVVMARVYEPPKQPSDE